MTKIKGWLAQDIKISVVFVQERNLSLKENNLLIFQKTIFKIDFVKME